jgi:hypothetical protein
MKVPVLACRVAGRGRRRAVCWRSYVMRYAGFTGSLADVTGSPGILRCPSYTSSATGACKSALNYVRMSRRTSGSASVEFRSAWHMMATFSVRWNLSTSPLAAG